MKQKKKTARFSNFAILFALLVGLYSSTDTGLEDFQRASMALNALLNVTMQSKKDEDDAEQEDSD